MKKVLILITLLIVVVFTYIIVSFNENVSLSKAVDTLVSTNKIVVNKLNSDSEKVKYEFYKTFTEESDINTVVDILARGYEFDGWRNLDRPENTYLLEFYDIKGKIIATVIFDSDGFLNIKSQKYNINFKLEDDSELMNMLVESDIVKD